MKFDKNPVFDDIYPFESFESRRSMYCFNANPGFKYKKDLDNLYGRYKSLDDDGVYENLMSHPLVLDNSEFKNFIELNKNKIFVIPVDCSCLRYRIDIDEYDDNICIFGKEKDSDNFINSNSQDTEFIETCNKLANQGLFIPIHVYRYEFDMGIMPRKSVKYKYIKHRIDITKANVEKCSNECGIGRFTKMILSLSDEIDKMKYKPNPEKYYKVVLDKNGNNYIILRDKNRESKG